MRGIENNDRVGDFTVERDCDMKGHGIRKVARNNFESCQLHLKRSKTSNFPYSQLNQFHPCVD